jgi:predicted dehydrogenase
MSSTAGSEPVYDVLIVGCGAIAGGYDQADKASEDILTHAKAFTVHSGFRIVACVDPDESRRKAFQAYWGIAKGFASLDAVDVPFDVASLCTPTGLHVEGLQALADMAPKLVFAEKPVTDDLALTRTLVNAYRDKRISLCVNHLRRWAPGIAALRAEIAAGAWGRLHRGVACYTKGLLNNGSHMADMLHFLIGPLRPVAPLAAIADGRIDDPTIDALLSTVEGASIHLVAADCNDYSLFELDLLFSGGRVTLTDGAFTIVRRKVEPSPRFAGYEVLAEAIAVPSGLDRALLGAADNIHRHLFLGEALASDGQTALAAQDVCTTLAQMPRTVFR